MTRSSKHQNFIKCSLDSGKKGTLGIRKTNRSFRRHRAANIAAANADCYKEGVIGRKTTAAHQKNTIIGENHELIGVLKE